MQPAFGGDLPYFDQWGGWKRDAFGDWARNHQARYFLLFQLPATTTRDHHVCPAHERQQDLLYRAGSSRRTESSGRGSRCGGENSIFKRRNQLKEFGNWVSW